MLTSLPPHAMINQYGDLFYPDGPDDARYFAQEHQAWPVLPKSFPWAVVFEQVPAFVLEMLRQPWSELPPELR